MALNRRLSGYDHRLVRRIASILNCIGSSCTPMRLVDITNRTGLDNATAYRILSELVREGFVYKNRTTRCYAPGLKICEIGSSDLARSSAAECLQPYVARVGMVFGVAPVIATLSGTAVHIHDMPSASIKHPAVQQAARSGFAPAHATAVGKLLLSTMAELEVSALYSNLKMPRYTPRTTENLETLLAELNQIRMRGYATEMSEFVHGLYGIGLLATSRAARPAFGLWIAVSQDRFKHIANPALIRKAKEILAEVDSDLLNDMSEAPSDSHAPLQAAFA